MISVERKYLLLFFIRWNGFIGMLKHISRSKFVSFMEEAGPILLFGPLLGRYVGGDVKKGLLVLIPASLLMVGGPLASMLTLLFGLMGAAFYLLASSAWNILYTYFTGGNPLPGVGPVIPGVEVGPFYIPFVEGWLSILLIFLIHEGAHGVVALRRGMGLQDAAMVILGIIPVAAYVQPNEKKFLASSPEDRVKVIAAGPFANTVAFILSTILLIGMGIVVSPYMEKILQNHALGVKVLEVPDTIEINGKALPSLVKGLLSPGDVIVSINEKNVYTIGDIIEVLHSDAKELNILVLRGGELISFSIENKGYLGVKGGQVAWRESPPLEYSVLSFLLSFLLIFSLLNIMVAVVNALPFSILDGGQAIEDLEKRRRINARLLKLAASLLLAINILPWFI